MTPTSRREDIFVSVCLPDLPATREAAAGLQRLCGDIAARFRYWEVLLTVPADGAEAYEPLMARIGNIRLLKLRHGTPFYRRRVAGAAEAIGDVVVLTAIDEQPDLDLPAMIEAAAAASAIVIGRRRSRSAMNPLLEALGHSAGFRVSARSMLTAAYPRTLLNKLLAHPDPQLALRFPPMDQALPVLWQTATARRRHRMFGDLGRKLGLVQKLLVSSAPRVLALVALLSLLVAGGSLALAVYAVVVWLTFSAVQPGWFTLTLALSLTALFLSIAIFGLSIGVQKMIESLSGALGEDILDERSSVDLFGQVMKELNVEVVDETPPVLSGQEAVTPLVLPELAMRGRAPLTGTTA
ncbi:hypothetical protein [Rhodobacter sp. CZR27]|uniref:hypothetical protein n=1 Tax=Rhodobacter sp. CZR27 TaxID=2033869 RepID=UPI0018E09D6E|nr:hypothetical protein [Rhodobacter sp. CZR27]